MTVSRRTFLMTTAATGTAAVATTLGVAANEPEHAVQATTTVHLPLLQNGAATRTTTPAPTVPPAPSIPPTPTEPPPPSVPPTPTAPSIEVIALSRMAFGARPGDVAAVRKLGFERYVEQQLQPASIDDSACDALIAAARIRTRYGSVDEVRPLTSLDKSAAQLWPLSDWKKPRDWQERILPFKEVRVATLIRAVHSKRQLQEVLVSFWHNHFNVAATSDAAIAATLPVYDRDVIRKHCLGNFRTFLEAVTKSTAMMFYLDNRSNRAAGGEGSNENFARELLELHTLGADAYIKTYDDRRHLGVDADGNARGYIDDDVYEVARCLSGWTIADGTWVYTGDTLPNTGAFYYHHSTHDTAPKTVLSPDGYPNVARNQRPMEDGRRVLDLVANHRATARHLCTKLCRRLIADNPPAAVVDAAVKTWMENIKAPDQIARVVRVILRSPEFRSTWGQKMKLPMETLASYLRATNATLSNDTIDKADPTRGFNWDAIFWRLGQTGQRPFEWPTPNGMPDVASYWATTNGMLQRWNLPYVVVQWWGGNTKIDLTRQTPTGLSCTAIVDFWIDRLCGYAITPSVRQSLIAFMAQGGDVNRPPAPTPREPDWGAPAKLVDRLNSMVQLLAMSPDFQMR